MVSELEYCCIPFTCKEVGGAWVGLTHLVWVWLILKEASELVHILGQPDIREVSSMDQHIPWGHLELVCAGVCVCVSVYDEISMYRSS